MTVMPLPSWAAAARQADLPEDVIATFMAEAMADDYDHLPRTAMLWFTCV